MNNLTDEQVLENETQYWVEMQESLTRLEKHPDFQRVILSGYFRDKAVNGVSMLANDQTIAQGKRPAVIEGLIAISHLEDHFITIKTLGTLAPADADDGEELEA